MKSNNMNIKTDWSVYVNNNGIKTCLDIIGVYDFESKIPWIYVLKYDNDSDEAKYIYRLSMFECSYLYNHDKYLTKSDIEEIIYRLSEYEKYPISIIRNEVSYDTRWNNIIKGLNAQMVDINEPLIFKNIIPMPDYTKLPVED